jgi:hypothetical protein
MDGLLMPSVKLKIFENRYNSLHKPFRRADDNAELFPFRQNGEKAHKKFRFISENANEPNDM